MSAAPDRIRFVCVLSIPRTGTSHLCELLKSCPEINVKGELFHKSLVEYTDEHEVAALRATAQGAITDDASLFAWRLEHPRETLETMYEAGGRRVVFLKLFPTHLYYESVKPALFGRGDIRFLLLRRRPIECFVSEVKARSTTIYRQHDTTAMKPVLDTAHFMAWAKKHRRWYEMMDSLLAESGVPFANITYEHDIVRENDRETLSRMLATLQGLGLPPLMIESAPEGLPRQDREPMLNRRVANWKEFRTAVMNDSRGKKLFRWAMALPTSGDPILLSKENGARVKSGR